MELPTVTCKSPYAAVKEMILLLFEKRADNLNYNAIELSRLAMDCESRIESLTEKGLSKEDLVNTLMNEKDASDRLNLLFGKIYTDCIVYLFSEEGKARNKEEIKTKANVLIDCLVGTGKLVNDIDKSHIHDLFENGLYKKLAKFIKRLRTEEDARFPARRPDDLAMNRNPFIT